MWGFNTSVDDVAQFLAFGAGGEFQVSGFKISVSERGEMGDERISTE
jgi:hypothetical protein